MDSNEKISFLTFYRQTKGKRKESKQRRDLSESRYNWPINMRAQSSFEPI